MTFNPFAQQADEPTLEAVHTPAPMAQTKRPRFLTRLYERIRAAMTGGAVLTQEAFDEIVRHARGHAGGMGKADRLLVDPPAVAAEAEMIACPSCGESLPPDSDVCPECGADLEVDADGPAQAAEVADLCAAGQTWRLFIERQFADAPDWMPYLPKPGTYAHPSYGEIVITPERNARFVTNFAQRVYQDRLPVDAEHQTKLSGATGWITSLRQNEDGSVDAKVEWTDRGRALLADNRFAYVSPEWYDAWQDPATQETHQDVAIGAALTTRPFFKSAALRPLIASERGLEMPDIAAGSWIAPEETDRMNEQQFAELRDQARQMAEQIAALQTENTRLAAENRQAGEHIAAMQADAQQARLRDIIKTGKFVGSSADHLRLLTDMARAFGEESEQIRLYVQQQRAMAAQVEASGLFRAFGGDGSGSTPTAWDQIEAAAVKIRAAHPDLTSEQAISRACSENPALYRQYQSERASA